MPESIAHNPKAGPNTKTCFISESSRHKSVPGDFSSDYLSETISASVAELSLTTSNSRSSTGRPLLLSTEQDVGTADVLTVVYEIVEYVHVPVAEKLHAGVGPVVPVAMNFKPL